MTLQQRRSVQSALRHYGLRHWANSAENRLWRDAIDQALAYYDDHDPIRSDLMRLRYIQRRTEDQTIDRLHIGRTTYKKAHDDLLSTIAVFAAQRGVMH